MAPLRSIRKLEKKWLREGKSKKKQRALRYYYRNKDRILLEHKRLRSTL